VQCYSNLTFIPMFRCLAYKVKCCAVKAERSQLTVNLADNEKTILNA